MGFAPVESDLANNECAGQANNFDNPSIEVLAALIEEHLAGRQDVFSQGGLQFKVDLLAQIAHASRFLELEVAAAHYHGYGLSLQEIHEVVDAFDMSGLARHSRSFALPVIMATGSSKLRQAYLVALSTSSDGKQTNYVNSFAPMQVIGSDQGAACRGHLSLIS